MRRNIFGVVLRLLATSSSSSSNHNNLSNRLLYEHGYHAGNYADVVKHSVLVQLLECMTKKKSPFSYVETHAGAGGYALTSQLAEHEQGISKLLLRNDPSSITTTINSNTLDDQLHSSTETLLEIMEQVSKQQDFDEDGEEPIYYNYYPGSPMIAAALCREQDSMLFCEKEAEQFELLKRRMMKSHIDNRSDRITLLQENGYKALKRFENIQSNQRALIFVDPPYQMGSDSEQIAALVKFLQTHWRSARVAIWHPVSSKNRDKADRLYELVRQQIIDTTCSELLATELYNDNDDTTNDLGHQGVVGTGMLLVNPPYGIDQELESLYASLGAALSGGSGNPNIMIQRL